ncbi:MAG: hypothetical protein KKF24_00230 [Gammaproteobacteria bacterium]|nr:hypothetical protein [Gammaproteobacteria bacterium]MBU1831099.1 hypothetical protein [Gammaproteobacteria bacterium]
MNKKIITILVGLALAGCGGSSGGGSGGDPDSGPGGAVEDSAQLRVLSNRPDLVSAGDVLVEVVLENAEAVDDLVLTRNGSDVTSVLHASPDNPLRLLGVVDGLAVGDNTLSANIGNDITVVNHPSGGPVFTGPHIQPWKCQDTAADEDCNQPVEYTWLYKSTNPLNGGLQPYDPENPASDVAMTTTDTGETLPFIVRQEKGYQARDQYTIFTLQKVGEDWTPVQPQSQWNRRLLVTHGGNCRGDRDTSSPKTDDYSGTIPGNPLIDQSYITALGLGWSVLSTAQLNLGHNCNLSYQAESLMMAKERFIEQYGELRYTVGTGCSGGAITQNMIANAYPGLYQGLLTTCTYPDVMSTATQFADYHILLRYFKTNMNDPALLARDGTLFTVLQQNEVYGHLDGIVNASVADSALFAEAVDPASSCGGISDEERFDQDTNPSGARCDVLTFMQNMIGQRERFPAEDQLRDHWSQIEKDLGYGFSGFPLGNEGVQYGLIPLQQGTILPSQFLKLNTNIGGLDPSLNVTAERLKPDYPALPNAYRTGILNTAVNMDTVPIINMTGPDPGIAHDSVHGYWVRWRLEREFGNRDNFVHWGGLVPLVGDLTYMSQSLVAMASWLDAIEADTSDTPLAEKIVTNKPASVQDQCSGVPGQMCPEELMLVFGTPRTQAGADKYGDQVQCQLKPFSRVDNYGLGNIIWQEADWQKLEQTFATGVCDWSKKPLAWQPTIPWLTYQDDLGDVIIGGEQMAPAEFPAGWASPAFSKTWVPGWQQP